MLNGQTLLQPPNGGSWHLTAPNTRIRGTNSTPNWSPRPKGANPKEGCQLAKLTSTGGGGHSSWVVLGLKAQQQRSPKRLESQVLSQGSYHRFGKWYRYSLYFVHQRRVSNFKPSQKELQKWLERPSAQTQDLATSPSQVSLCRPG